MLATLSAIGLLASVRVEVTPLDGSLRSEFESYAADAEKRITEFFGAPFRKDIVVKILPDRKAFDEALHRQWKMEPTQPWMVGAAGAEVVFVLSPRVWKTEAAEHNPMDKKATSEILCHELVHSYHSQRSPTRDLEGLDEMGWFAEGLATYVSGQLERTHKGVAKRELSEGRGPKNLESAWSGRGRYGIAGSMVQYVDLTYGRKKVTELLGLTTNQAALAALVVSEEEFLRGWAKWVKE